MLFLLVLIGIQSLVAVHRRGFVARILRLDAPPIYVQYMWYNVFKLHRVHNCVYMSYM